MTIAHNVLLASTEGVGLLTTLELICLWTDLLKRTSWQTKPLELVKKEQLQLTTLLTDSLTWFTALLFFMIVLLQRQLRGHLIMESQQVIGFLILLLYTDVVRHTGATEGTVTNDWLT